MSAALGSSYAPDFRVFINGAEMPAQMRATVTSIRYEDGMNAADRVEIGLANPDLYWLSKHIRGMGFQPFPTSVPAPPGMPGSIVPEGLLDIDNTVELSMGYVGACRHMFKGEITGVSATFPNGGMPTLTVVAHDKLNRLAQGKVSRGFGLLPDFLIAMLLAAENRIIPFIDPAIVGASTVVAVLRAIFVGSGTKQEPAQSDLEMLAKIAKSYDADFWVEDDVLYLSRFMKSYTPSTTLRWRSSLMDFAPKLTTVGQVAGVSMKFTLRELPLDFLVSVFWDFDHERLGISILPGVAAAAGAAFTGPSFTIVDRPIASPADLANSALQIVRELRTRLNKRMTGSGTAVGDPSIRAGELIRVDGLGPDFSGDYRVSGATHTIDGSGYQTHVDVFRELIP